MEDNDRPKDLGPLNLKDVPDQLGNLGRWLWQTLGPLLLEDGELVAADRERFSRLCFTFEMWRIAKTMLERDDGKDPKWTEGHEQMLSHLNAELSDLGRQFSVTPERIKHLQDVHGPHWPFLGSKKTAS